MKLSSLVLSLVCAAVVPLGSPAQPASPAITVRGLVAELTDPDALARWPDPAYSCREASSYDRTRTTPDRPGWFANHGNSEYLRVEQQAGRRECVMLDADGPGAIVRFWNTNGGALDNPIRVYLDGSPEPTLFFPQSDLHSGDLKVGPPLLSLIRRPRGMAALPSSCRYAVEGLTR